MTIQSVGDTKKPKSLGVLVVSGNWWALAARMASALARNGCTVDVVCPPGHPLRYVRNVRSIFPLRIFGLRSSLLAAIAKAEPDLIIPCDDRSVFLLHEIYRSKLALRPLIERSLGDAGGFQVTRSRARLQSLAVEQGIRTPRGQEIISARHAAESYSQFSPIAVLKLDGTYGGEGVQIVRSREEAAAAFDRLSRTAGLGTSIKRLLVNRDPFALWAWRRRIHAKVLMQEYIVGTPANIMVACWQGEVLAGVSVDVLSSQGTTGAANVVRLVERPEFEIAARLIAKRLEISGFYGLDFIIESKSNRSYLIEMNPRCTQLGHLRLPQGDLASALYARATGRVCRGGDSPITENVIAFFPQAEKHGGAAGPWPVVFYDVPWDEAALVEVLKKNPWPERRVIARIYHWVRRPRAIVPVEFKESSEVPLGTISGYAMDGAQVQKR